MGALVWKVSINGQVYDADFETLKQWVAQGSVGPTDQVYKEGMGWSEARNVPVLRDLFAPPPSAAPPSFGGPTYNQSPGYDQGYGKSQYPPDPYGQSPNPYPQPSNPYGQPSNPYAPPPSQYAPPQNPYAPPSYPYAPPSDPYSPAYGMPPAPMPGYGGMFDNGAVADLKSDAKKALILSIVSFFCCGVILGSLSIYYGVNARNGLRNYGVEDGQGMALAAIIIGIISVVLNVLVLLARIGNIH